MSYIKKFNKNGDTKGGKVFTPCEILKAETPHWVQDNNKEKKGRGGGHLVTYLLNNCNIRVYLWHDWRAGIMNGFSEVI